MIALHVFNPTHDLAMANGSAHFKAPESILMLTHDLSLLPLWYGHDGDVIISDVQPTENPLNIQKIIRPLLEVSKEDFDAIIPWGWNAVILKELQLNGLTPEQLPTEDQVEKIRQLSHRKLTQKALHFLKEHLNSNIHLPKPARLIEDINSIKEEIADGKEIVLKAPWSGSGRGLFWCKDNLTPSILGWCKRILEKQGNIMAEDALDKVQDFAMEFACCEGKSRFRGYSLFYTENQGVYRGNRLMTNQAIEDELGSYVPTEHLHQIQEQLIKFIDQEIAPYYSGPMGIDMIIYKDENGKMQINPMIEINIRMTMGMVARQLYDNHIQEGVKGWFNIEHLPPGEILEAHLHDQQANPIVIEQGKLKSGYLSLCPINDSTTYRARLILGE